MTPKRPDDEITKIIYAGLTIEAGDMDKVIQQLKSLFKKLAHGAVPEKRDILSFNDCKREFDYEITLFANKRSHIFNQSIDETHERIDKIWGSGE